MKKRKKAFPSREAYHAWRESIQARILELRAYTAHIDAELATKRKPAA